MRYLLPGSKIFCELEPSNLNSAILEVITESSVNNLGLVLVSSTLEYCNLTLFPSNEVLLSSFSSKLKIKLLE
ncbi:Uncharacterised protein [Chlamydia trachomatis]|nr:Uncharacterised protein [Chlamydia trachomatis]